MKWLTRLVILSGLSGSLLAAETMKPLDLSIEQAVLMALESNLSLKVQRFQPQITKTFEELEAARFDTSLSADISANFESQPQLATSIGGDLELKTDNYSSSLGLERQFSTGTTLSGEISSRNNHSNSSADSDQLRIGLTLTQALLRGLGSEVNLVGIQQAQLDTQISRYELQGFAESLVGDVEQRYWEYVLALQQEHIFEQALDVAEQQRDVVLTRIEVGLLAETESPSAEAEVARRYRGLVEARFAKEKLRLQLIGHITIGTEQDWQAIITPVTQVVESDYSAESITEHLALAQQLRPELKEAELRQQRGDLEVVQTRNALLPKLDFFLHLGKSGYSDSFSDASSNINQDSYDASVGLNFLMPIGNRAAESDNQRAQLSLKQTRASLKNLLHLVQLDVRVAYSELQLVQEKIDAATVTRKLHLETLRAENEKFKVGRSTTIEVALAQRDLLQAQLDEMETRIEQKKAAIRLYQLEGSLLKRRGVVLP
ncbi:MAG: TolC family protein [Pseudomonadales bacterium]|nr:TolC family protein [Pseudomonadales bacterium]